MSDAQGNPEPDRTGTPDPDRAGTPEPGGMARAAASPDNDAARVREHHQRVHDRFRQNQHQADYAQTSTHPHDPVPNQGTQPYYASSHDLGVSPLFTAKSQYRLSDFTLLETLGTGTFGRVYLTRLSRDQGTQDRFYAMKVLKKSEVVRLKQVEHINSEKQILSQVYFPFIVNLFTTFQDDRNLYMLLEYVIGGELFSHLRKAGRFTNDITRFYAAEIVLAIEYLHDRDIIYRDLKPENLLLDKAGHVKITDFGFAKKVEDRTWTLCGTPEYLAPEIIQSKGHGKPVDWWALGILIFEMLAGYPPFFDDNPFGIYEKILAGRIYFPAYIESDAKDLIKKLLTADRTRRLGNLRGGSEDVKNHRWFRGVDWQGLMNKSLTAPIIPPHAHPGDTGNFEKYPEEADRDAGQSGDPYRSLFAEF